jgi:inorganic pyrophosphatase
MSAGSTRVEVTIEIPTGGRNKYEVDHVTGRLRLDRRLFTPFVYPADYGFIEDTLGKDGDPLDILVLLDEPTFPGVQLTARPVGMFDMADENGDDEKIVAVLDGDPRWAHIQDVEDIPRDVRDRIQHFFAHYKDLEPGKFVKTRGFRPLVDAERVIQEATRAYRKHDVYES